MFILVEVYFNSFVYYFFLYGWLVDIFSFLRIFFIWIFKKREKKFIFILVVLFNCMNILLYMGVKVWLEGGEWGILNLLVVEIIIGLYL